MKVECQQDRSPGQSSSPGHEAEERMRAIVDHVLDGIVTINERGEIDSFNPAAERLFGYAKGEVLGQNVKILMPEPYHGHHDEYLASYLRTGSAKIIGIGREVVGRRKDGSIFPMDLAVSEFRLGTRRYFTGIVRDITERKQSAQRIRDQARLLESVRESIFVCDLEGRIQYWNSGSEELYGWSGAEVLGRPWQEVQAGIKEIMEARRQTLAKGEWQGELKPRTKSGRPLTINAYWTLIRNDEGLPHSFLVIAIDATERKKLESQLLRSQRLESIGVLVGGIAHDFNNLLTPILMSLKLLRKDRSPQQREELLTTAQASVERGIAIVKQLLSFAGGTVGERTTLNLREVVDEVHGLLKHTLPKSINIQLDIEGGLWPVTGDRTQISQVLMNLCVNTRDAMPEGGTLYIGAENLVVRGEGTFPHAEAKPGPYVALTVADTGEGIPADVLDKIFDPFFTTKEIGKGTGLGLSTALGIVKDHGGFINVYSEVGKGTRFNVYLPATPTDAVKAEQETSAEARDGTGETILVIDDEPMILMTAKAILEEKGYRVLTAGDGQKGVGLFRDRHKQVDAVLLDMMMPGLDGPAVVAALQSIEPNVKIIATSGLSTSDRLKRVMAAGARAFLQKPYGEEQLLDSLHQVLQEQTQRGR